MLEKFERPPLGMELSNVQMQTSQTRRSLSVSMTWDFLRCEFCVPDWLFFVRNKAATFSASVNRLALTGLSGRKTETRAPMIIVNAPIATKKILQLANLESTKLIPYASKPPTICVRELHT